MTIRIFSTCFFLFIVGYVSRVSAQAFIPFKTAYRMVANYAPRAGFVQRGDQQLPNSRTVWFDLARLRQMVDQIEADGGDGIRIYFAAYDNAYTSNVTEDGQVPPREYWGYNTLLLVPTRDSIINGGVYHRDYFDPIDSTIVNRGLLCPPDCGDCPLLLPR